MSDELCLTIPCKVDGAPKGPQPIYVGPPKGYLCPHCGQSRQRHTTMSKHMGLVMNIPASCPVYKKKDQERRKSVHEHLEQVRQQGYDDTWIWSPEKLAEIQKTVREEIQPLSDGLLEVRERARMNRQDA
jgi:hypothetical protein